MDEQESLQAAIHERVAITEPDGAWPSRFAAERTRLLDLFSGSLLSIEHVGSTAVEGLPAKPIIDILAAVPSLEEADAMIPVLCEAGYTTSKEFNESLKTSRWLMRHADGRRTVHLHLVPLDSREWRDKIRFRNQLRRDPSVRGSYLKLKRELAAGHSGDRERYTELKAAFIAESLNRAPEVAKGIIVHGTKGSPEGNWFPWLGEHLAAEDLVVFTPRMPTPDGQSLGRWAEHFTRGTGKLGGADVLIGHSLGAVFLLSLLQNVEEPVACAALVCGFIGRLGLEEYDRLNESFVNTPLRWDAIRRGAKKILVFAGESDPYVPQEQSELLAAGLGVPLRIIPGGKHLNTESGYNEFPELLDAVLLRTPAKTKKSVL